MPCPQRVLEQGCHMHYSLFLGTGLVNKLTLRARQIQIFYE
jgi:hypothetical protein